MRLCYKLKMRIAALERLFVRHYDRAMAPLERHVFGAARVRLLPIATGRVLEVGAGTGANFAYYRDARVTAIDPEWGMLEQSLHRPREVEIGLVAASAEILPFRDGAFDTVVSTLVFCTIPKPARALAEVRRVLRAGGRLIMLEHVRSRSRFVGLTQDALTPLQKTIAGGCHLNRKTQQLVEDNGFDVITVRGRFASSLLEIQAVKS